MNRARVAQLLRELADAVEEDGDVASPPAPKSAPRQRRERKPRAMIRPEGEASPAVAGRAAALLREKGFR